ncbi:MAG: serine/threonine protein kinase [Bradymonadia bacterium]
MGDNQYAGLVLGEQYEVVRPVGAGGMGQVYQGRQLSTGGRVAIKLMSTLDRSQKTIDRFKYEAETTAQLTHPNTVRILDFGSDGDVFYLVMEYLSGTDLTRFLRPDGQSDAFVSHVLFQTVCSLAEAHSRGVVHRDIKPNNIMLLHHVGHPSFVKVIDFGIARAIGGPGHGTLGILGTIGYIAPEQASGDLVPDARTDLYALGCVAYELLTGRLPFDGITHKSAPLEVLEAHKAGNPTDIAQIRPNTDPELAHLIMRLLSRNPVNRPQSVGELVVPLHKIRSRCSGGIAYAADVDTPHHGQQEATPHQNVVYSDQFNVSTADGTLCDGDLNALGFAVTSAQGVEPVVTSSDLSPHPSISPIPTPPFGVAQLDAPESSTPEISKENTADEWTMGSSTTVSHGNGDVTDADPASTSRPRRIYLLTFLAGGSMTGLCWFIYQHLFV